MTPKKKITNKKRTNLKILIIILILSIGLRLYNLGAQPLYVDEAWSYYAGNDLRGAVIKTLNYEEHPPLFNILSFFWRSLGLGYNEFALRLLPVLCGAASVLLVYFIAKELINNRVALLSALIMAISSEHLRMSQEFRPYEVLVFFIAASTYFFIKAIKNNEVKYWTGYVIFIVLAGYTDHFSVFFMASVLIYFIMFLKKHKDSIKNFIISELVAAILLIPNVWIGLSQLDFLNHMTQNVIQSKYWHILILPYNFYVFIFGSSGPFMNGFAINRIYVPLLIISLIIFSILIIKGFMSLIKEKENFFFLTIIFLLPIILLYLISFITYMQLEPKRFLFVTFPLYIIMAIGLDSIKSKKIFAAAFAFFLVVGSLSIYSYYGTEKERFDLVADYISENSKEGDVIFISMNMLELPFQYYYNGNIPTYGLPKDYITPEDYSGLRRNLGSLFITEDNFKQSIDTNMKSYKRMWFIQSRENVLDPNEYVLQYLDKKYTMVSLKRFSDGMTKVYLYSK